MPATDTTCGMEQKAREAKRFVQSRERASSTINPCVHLCVRLYVYAVERLSRKEGRLQCALVRMKGTWWTAEGDVFSRAFFNQRDVLRTREKTGNASVGNYTRRLMKRDDEQSSLMTSWEIRWFSFDGSFE